MTPSTTAIPEGHELLVGRSHENAKAAIALAEERGFDGASVLTTDGGYFIPLGDDADVEPDLEDDELEIPAKSASKAEQEAFAAEHGIDLSNTKNAEERHDAIEAWAAARSESTAGDDQKEN